MGVAWTLPLHLISGCGGSGCGSSGCGSSGCGGSGCGITSRMVGSGCGMDPPTPSYNSRLSRCWSPGDIAYSVLPPDLTGVSHLHLQTCTQSNRGPRDCTTVPSDCTTVLSDCTTVPSDCMTVLSDCTTVPSDCTTVPSDCTTVPSDCTE